MPGSAGALARHRCGRVRPCLLEYNDNKMMKDIASRMAVRAVVALSMLFPSGTAWGQGEFVDDVLQHAPMGAVFALRAFYGDHGRRWEHLALTAAGSYAAGTATTYSLKHIVRERRPDGSDRRSFPSGHATYAFAGATMLRHEYGHLSPWVTIGGYGVATLVALDRVRQDRHYLHDVCAGAVIGMASTELSYFLSNKFLRSRNVTFSFSGQSLQLAVRW